MPSLNARYRLAAGLLATLLLAACSKPAPAPIPAPTDLPATTKPPTQHSAPEQSPREKAMALLREGRPLEAAAYLKEVVAAEPTADNWNDLSYAYLLGREYKLAQEAGWKAIELNNKHAGAWYNRGMAYLESGNLNEAGNSLSLSAKYQPDRYEPHLALARVYVAERNGPLASHHLREAERLAPNAPDVAAQKPAVGALFDYDVQQVPANLSEKCAQLKEAALCLNALPGHPGKYELYYLPTETGTKAQRITIGHLLYPDGTVARAQLPGGVPGYWLREGDAVADMRQWHLFALKDGRLQPVASNIRHFEKPPEIKGDTILSSAFTADRTGLIHSVWKLSPDLTSATRISETKGGFK